MYVLHDADADGALLRRAVDRIGEITEGQRTAAPNAGGT
jgi:hypothetical protein